MTKTTDTNALSLLACDEGFDPIEDRLRANIRSTIEAVFNEELDGFLGRLRYGRDATGPVKGYRHGHRERQITGTFGTETISVPRARIEDEGGKVAEWRSQALPRYQRLTKRAEALIASVYLSGTNTRRVKRALYALFKGAVSKDVVSRAWRKVKTDWDAWCARSLAGEDIVRVILDGTVIKTRIDRKATNISVLAAIGVRRDGQKVLLSIKNMGGESTAAWRQFLDDLDARGLKRPEFVIVDGAPGLEAALVALWGDNLPIQRCTVHKHRNLLGQAYGLYCHWAAPFLAVNNNCTLAHSMPVEQEPPTSSALGRSSSSAIYCHLCKWRFLAIEGTRPGCSEKPSSERW
jgi:transposase-like protein